MRRRTFFLSLSGLAGCTRDRRPWLNVYNWSEYVAPDTIPNFEKEFGVRVRYGIYESNEEMLAKVQSGNSGWDVVFPSNYLIEPMRQQELLADLRHDWLPNLDHLDARFRAPVWDQHLRHNVPYMSGASGILYGPALDRPLSGWSDLWDARLAGRMTMLDDPAEVLGACLKRLGFSLNSTDARELDQARIQAIVGHHLGASDRGGAETSFCLSGGRLRRVLRQWGDFA
jgi:spermidine/putrescine-binding protein